MRAFLLFCLLTIVFLLGWIAYFSVGLFVFSLLILEALCILQILTVTSLYTLQIVLTSCFPFKFVYSISYYIGFETFNVAKWINPFLLSSAFCAMLRNSLLTLKLQKKVLHFLQECGEFLTTVLVLMLTLNVLMLKLGVYIILFNLLCAWNISQYVFIRKLGGGKKPKFLMGLHCQKHIQVLQKQANKRLYDIISKPKLSLTSRICTFRN